MSRCVHRFIQNNSDAIRKAGNMFTKQRYRFNDDVDDMLVTLVSSQECGTRRIDSRLRLKSAIDEIPDETEAAVQWFFACNANAVIH
jgi:hypothetical protein